MELCFGGPIDAQRGINGAPKLFWFCGPPKSLFMQMEPAVSASEEDDDLGFEEGAVDDLGDEEYGITVNDHELTKSGKVRDPQEATRCVKVNLLPLADFCQRPRLDLQGQPFSFGCVARTEEGGHTCNGRRRSAPTGSMHGSIITLICHVHAGREAMVELEVDGQEGPITVSRDTLRRKKLGVDNKPKFNVDTLLSLKVRISCS